MAPASLNPLAAELVRETGLEQLILEYGDKLRIAVDHETCLVAITGSHVRVCILLMPMVF